MSLLTGKTALITGAARGIGKAIALRFAQEGANIAFTDLVLNDDMAAGLEATRKEIEAVGVTCRAYAGNAADFAETEATVKKIKEDFGTIDILVNNAGITKDGLMLRMTEQQWDAVINVNLKSAFNFIHACVPVMMRQRGGSIINMASVVGVHGNAGQANYAASKAGMIALAKSVAQEMGPKGIRANAIAPGFIETAMTAALSDEIREEWTKKIPLRRGGQVEDIANVATFLASDMSSYVSGQVIQVDGGMNTQVNVYRLPCEAHYSVPSMDVLVPVGNAFPSMAYRPSGLPAAVAYPGQDYRCMAWGFPLECITDDQTRRSILYASLQFLLGR